MFKEALRVALMIVLKNHTYEFNKEIRKQFEGGPIGLDLTGTVAKIFMSWWDGELKQRMESVGLESNLYERYVDDINTGLRATEVGARCVEGELKVTEEAKQEDVGIEADLRTFKVVQSIGNSIHPSIQVEVDVPSNYPDRRVPILDLKVGKEKVRTANGEVWKIVHKHYMKPMANKFVIRSDAAMAMKTKRTVLTQMCLRVLLNNSEYLEEEEKKSSVSFFMRRMQASGYSEKFRYEVLKSAVNAYEKICNDPTRPKYRGKELNTPKARQERNKQKNSWFRKGGYESVMFVLATPGSELRRMIQEEVSGTSLKIRVVERAGVRVKKMLQKNDPFKDKTCNEENCLVCSTTGEGKCRKSGVTYEIECQGDCGGDNYNGETHSNGYTRGLQHAAAYQNKREHSVMWKHCVKKHNGEEQDFVMRVKDQVKNDATKRLILEAVRINEVEEDHRINDKEEWIIGKIPAVTVSTL